jgi:hypothetical protein
LKVIIFPSVLFSDIYFAPTFGNNTVGGHSWKNKNELEMVLDLEFEQHVMIALD